MEYRVSTNPCHCPAEANCRRQEPQYNGLANKGCTFASFLLRTLAIDPVLALTAPDLTLASIYRSLGLGYCEKPQRLALGGAGSPITTASSESENNKSLKVSLANFITRVGEARAFNGPSWPRSVRTVKYMYLTRSSIITAWKPWFEDRFVIGTDQGVFDTFAFARSCDSISCPK